MDCVFFSVVAVVPSAVVADRANHEASEYSANHSTFAADDGDGR